MSDTKTNETPRVWIGNLQAYNNGELIGEWVDAVNLGDLEDAEQRVVKAGGGEEFALFDREGFGNLIGEYTQLETVAKIGELLEEHGDAFRFFCDNAGLQESDAADAEDDFHEAYRGQWGGTFTSGGPDYAENLAEETGAISADAAWPLNHIDWNAAWRELTMDGYWEQDGHIFCSY